MTYTEFAEKHSITLEYERAPANPHMTGKGAAEMAHWYVTLAHGERREGFYYSKGPGLRRWKLKSTWPDRVPEGKAGQRYDGPVGQPFARVTIHDQEQYERCTEPEPPDVSEVLECLALDVSWTDYSIDELAEEFGGEMKPSEAIRLHQAIHENGRKLRRVLGEAWGELGECEA